MSRIQSHISTYLFRRPRLEVTVTEFEPFLINRGQLLLNRKILYYATGGREVIFAVAYDGFEYLRRNLHMLYLPRELPSEPGNITCTISARNTGIVQISGTVIDLVSYSSFSQRESTPNIREIFFSGFPTEGFECRLRLDVLRPDEVSRIVVSLEGEGIKKVRYSYGQDIPGAFLVRSHYYIRPLEQERNLLVLDNQKIRLPEIEGRGTAAYLLQPNYRVWEKLKIRR